MQCSCARIAACVCCRMHQLQLAIDTYCIHRICSPMSYCTLILYTEPAVQCHTVLSRVTKAIGNRGLFTRGCSTEAHWVAADCTSSHWQLTRLFSKGGACTRQVLACHTSFRVFCCSSPVPPHVTKWNSSTTTRSRGAAPTGNQLERAVRGRRRRREDTDAGKGTISCPTAIEVAAGGRGGSSSNRTSSGVEGWK
jgi:hypothetical protein